MGKKISVIYCIFSIAFFAALFLLFFARIGDIKKANTERVSAGFDQVRRVVEAAYTGQESFDTLYFKDTVRKFFSLDRDLDLLMVYSYDTGIEYLRARESRYLPAAVDLASLRGRLPLSYGSFSRTRIASSITVPRKSSFIIEGVYRTLHEREMFSVLRDTFIILLVFSIVTAALAFLLRLVSEPSAKMVSPPAGPRPRAAVKTQGASAKTGGPGEVKAAPKSDAPQKPESKKPPLAESAPAAAEPVEEKAAAAENTGSYSGLPLMNELVPFTEEAIARDAAPAEPGSEWKSQLEKRITLELERSAYNEQDLTLILLRIPGMVRESSDYKYLAHEIQSKLSFEDLTFAYPPDSFAIVLPNSNLDQSLGTIKNFLKTVESGFSEHYESPLCGLSSRSGRLMDGPGLLREAEAALKKTAHEPGNTIIGFRPDPAKYRAYIAEQGPSANDVSEEAAP